MLDYTTLVSKRLMRRIIEDLLENFMRKRLSRLCGSLKIVKV